MYDVSLSTRHATPPVTFDWPRVKAALARQAGRPLTHGECARLTGVSLRTLDRLREDPASSLVRTLLAVRDASGLTLDEILPTANAASLPEAA